MTNQTEENGTGDSGDGQKGNFVVEYFKSFGLLKETRSDYWGMQTVNFIDHTIFFALMTIAVIFFSDDPEKFGFGLSDSHAGYIFAIFGSLTTISLFFTGLASDWLGIRKSMLVNQLAMLFLRGAIVWLAFNQSTFSGNLSLEIADSGQQLVVVDSTGGTEPLRVRGGGANGNITAEALGLLNESGVAADRLEGQAIEKPTKPPVVTIGNLLDRINFSPENDEVLRAKLSGDGMRLLLEDRTKGDGRLEVVDNGGSGTASTLGLLGVPADGELQGGDLFAGFSLDAFRPQVKLTELNRGKGVAIRDNRIDFTVTTRDGSEIEVNLGHQYTALTGDTLLADFRDGEGVPLDQDAAVPDILFEARDGNEYEVDLTGVATVEELIGRVGEGTGGHLTLAIGENERLTVTDTRGGGGTLKVLGAGANGSQAAQALGLFDEEGEEGNTLEGQLVVYSPLRQRVSTVEDVVEALNGLESNQGRFVAAMTADGLGLVVTDTTTGGGSLTITDAEKSTTAADLGLAGTAEGDSITAGALLSEFQVEKLTRNTNLSWLNEGRGVPDLEGQVDFTITTRDGTVLPIDLGEIQVRFTRRTRLSTLVGGSGVLISEDEDNADLVIIARNGDEYSIDLTEVKTIGDLTQRIDSESGGLAWLILALLFIAQAPFLALGQTAFQAANKRYTTKKSRGAGFNLWYLFMNVGAALAGLLIDALHIVMDLPRVHVFTTGIGTAVICLIVITLFVRRETQLYSPGEEPEETPEEEGKVKRISPWQNVKLVLSEPIFWRFTLLITLLLGVRSVFLYMHLLMPKFWLRVIGPDAYIGGLEAVNPALVIIGLILLIPILSKFSVYKMLVYGAMISALSLFILAIPATGALCYQVSIACLVVLTIGEVIWSPRLTEYTAAIAPKGQEGTYLGLSMVPYFFAKTIVAFASGLMLERWVPEPSDEAGLGLRNALEAGEIGFWDSPSAMWLILAIPALVGPVVALMLKGFFTKGAHFDVKHED
jgi:MFS family permease